MGIGRLDHWWNVVQHIPYFTDYKTHFFLRKIASKMQVRLILEIITKKCPVHLIYEEDNDDDEEGKEEEEEEESSDDDFQGF
jgi:hypothetical protein